MNSSTIIRTTLSGLLLASLLSPVLAAHHKPASSENRVTEWAVLEQNQWQNLVTVTAENLEQWVKLSISFHNQLLESDKTALTLTLNLSNQQLEQLHQLKVTVRPAEHWRSKRLSQLQQLVQSSINDAPAHKQLTGIPGYSCYPTVEETFTEAQQLAADNPTLAEWIDVGDSWNKTKGRGGYDLWVLKITNSTIAEQKPILFIHSAMHAREYTTAALNLDFARQLLADYPVDADTRWILDHHEIHLMFHMNPDGRKRAEAGVLWRKNTNDNYCQSNPGIDLNRNFTYFWNSTNGEGSSGNACDDTYRGPIAASEPETQAVEAYIRSIFADNRGEADTDAAPADTSGMHIDLHSYSELILWPWGHSFDPAPNGVQLQTLGRKLAWFNNYYPTQSTGLYPTDGTSDDVSYGELGVAAITFELGTSFFQPCSSYSMKIKPDNLKALKYAAKVVRAPYQLPAGPDLLQLQGNGSSYPQLIPGTSLTVSATADDTRYNNQKGTEPTQTIAAVRAYLDTPPWAQQATAIPLSATDGAFNSGIESVTGTLDTSNWEPGEHMLYLQAEDSDGNLGPVSALLIQAGDNQSPIAAFSIDCNHLECSFDGSNSSDDTGIVSYQWQLSDGSEYTGASFQHTFATSGTYSVELTVTDDAGATGVKTLDVTVEAQATNPPPTNNTSSSGGSLPLLALLVIIFSCVRNRY